MRDIISFSAGCWQKICNIKFTCQRSGDWAVFYVGKGAGDRYLHILIAALRSPQASDKLDKIRAIQERV